MNEKRKQKKHSHPSSESSLTSVLSVKASQSDLEPAELGGSLLNAAARPHLLMAPSSDPGSWLRLPRGLISEQK